MPCSTVATKVSEMCSEFTKNRPSLPPLVIVTPHDVQRLSSPWTSANSPSPPVFRRLQQLAREAGDMLTKLMICSSGIDIDTAKVGVVKVGVALLFISALSSSPSPPSPPLSHTPFLPPLFSLPPTATIQNSSPGFQCSHPLGQKACPLFSPGSGRHGNSLPNNPTQCITPVHASPSCGL